MATFRLNLKGRIAKMLSKQKKHISFHTPGHKKAGWDITELSYSDNLSSPTGVLKAAEEEIARSLGAEKSFILTDGSTCGILSMIWALKEAGFPSLAFSPYSHKSVKNGCKLAGLNAVLLPTKEEKGIPCQPTVEEVKAALEKADALLLTSPDYYGFFPDLSAISALCAQMKKPLLIDGAHGSHLHFQKEYAGNYADMWVDGVHKNLPAFTQGAVLSCKKEWAEKLGESLSYFRTTSPSYPIMASVEHAAKYPRNEEIEALAAWAKAETGAIHNDDWSKIVLPFGEYADDAQAYLERKGVYAEFNDGNYLMFYLSPATKKGEVKKLVRLLKGLPRGDVDTRAVEEGVRGGQTQYVALDDALGKTCAKECGLFPPCLPLIKEGEKISAQAIKKLQSGKSTFGLKEGQILVYTEE